jgi:hypothetical protein
MLLIYLFNLQGDPSQVTTTTGYRMCHILHSVPIFIGNKSINIIDNTIKSLGKGIKLFHRMIMLRIYVYKDINNDICTDTLNTQYTYIPPPPQKKNTMCTKIYEIQYILKAEINYN